MRLIDRAKNIIVTPKTEWDVIAAETTPPAALVTGYVLPLAAVAAIAGFIGMCFVGITMPLMPLPLNDQSEPIPVFEWDVVNESRFFRE